MYTKNDEWFQKITSSLHAKVLHEGVLLPFFPPDQTQVNTTGQSGANTLWEAYIFYRDCSDVFFQHSPLFQQVDKKLIDFGAGWGRILRFFLKDFRPDNLIGVDIDDKLLDICRETFSWGTFLKSEAFPPLNIPDNSVDFLVGYSVFSHLSEEACLAWVKEFARVLKPGGMVGVTTRGIWFLDYCKSLQSQNPQGYAKALSTLFPDFDLAKQKYDQGLFVHANQSGVTGGGVLDGTFYGESFIPESYAKKAFAEYFEVLDFHFIPGQSSHPIIFMKKR